VNLRVNESLPLMSEPLRELQWKQLSARLLAIVGPWCFFEMMLVDLERCIVKFSRHLAVFAAVPCPLPYYSRKGCVHEMLNLECVSSP